MHPHLSIKKIRNYSIIAFFIPLLTINACLAIYNILGNSDLYPNYNWDKKKVEYTVDEYELIGDKLDEKSFINCPKYKFSAYSNDRSVHSLISKSIRKKEHNIFNSGEGNAIFIAIEQGETLNLKCIKNHKFFYQVLSRLNFFEKILINVKKTTKAGFGEIRNPYIYGDVSISRTARYFPAILIFKPFIIISAFFLFLYWKNNLNLFNEITNNNTLNKFSKNFFYLGLLSSIFLTLHAIFLGIKFDNQLFELFRRLVITLFILFEVLAQIFLTMNLLKFREELKNFINPLILNIKVVFVISILIVTIFSFTVLILDIVDSNFKHILEWNYFSALLAYYFLSRLLWKSS